MGLWQLDDHPTLAAYGPGRAGFGIQLVPNGPIGIEASGSVWTTERSQRPTIAIRSLALTSTVEEG